MCIQIKKCGNLYWRYLKLVSEISEIFHWFLASKGLNLTFWGSWQFQIGIPWGQDRGKGRDKTETMISVFILWLCHHHWMMERAIVGWRSAAGSSCCSIIINMWNKGAVTQNPYVWFSHPSTHYVQSAPAEKTNVFPSLTPCVFRRL